eukprot:TRINITY_DN714_c0_g1_i1.p1 TRINITY_DN714_c0_g1~~TRINITY_DN714_c0_g1_i1.p1  ORF type:complete len:112 (+),score=3.99 TRINITY_DN714_c0_g1_i1:147-482(+)
MVPTGRAGCRGGRHPAALSTTLTLPCVPLPCRSCPAPLRPSRCCCACVWAVGRKEVELQARKREEEAEKAKKWGQANRNKKPEVYLTATRKLYCFCAALLAFMLFLVATSK